MFFTLSKVFWAVAEPGNALLILLVVGALMLALGWRRLGRTAVGVAVAGFLAIAILPLDYWLMAPLEDRFAAPDPMPAQVDGVVVLGGATDLEVAATREVTALNGAAERLTTLVTLAGDYPEARIVFTGGTGSLSRPDWREADYASRLVGELGVPAGRVLWERESRNTAENAAMSYELAAPSPGETWLLVTSASHMPRAVGAFRRAGWSVMPYPVDYATSRSGGSGLRFDLTRGLRGTNRAVREWIGLLAYWLTDRSDHFFPHVLPRG